MFVEQTLTIGVGLLELDRDAGLLRRHPLGPFGRRAAAYVRHRSRYPRLSGLGRADLCGVRHGADALDRLRRWSISNFQQQRYEADFRFNLVRVRENSEQIALLQGEAAERGRLLRRFGCVVDNWYAIMSRTKRLTAFTASYSQAAVIFPFVLVAPAYFADKIQLGGMMQTASAFGSVQERAVVLRRRLPDAGRMARGGRPPRRLRDGDRKRRGADGEPRFDRRRVIDRQRQHRSGTSFWSACPTERRWSRPTASASTAMNARWSPVRPAPASRPCSAPSPVSGRSAAARSRFPQKRR